MAVSVPGVAPGLLLCVSSVLGTYWGGGRETLAPASERLLCPIMLTPPPPPRGQHLSPMSVPKLHSHHGPQRKRRYLHCTPGAGEERTAIGDYPGAPATPGPAQFLGGTLLAYLEPFHGRSAGKLCLIPHSGHRPVQGGLDLNAVLSPPAPGQALGWALFLSFIFSCSNSQAACPVRPGGCASREQAPLPQHPAHQLVHSSTGPPLPSRVARNSHHINLRAGLSISLYNCQQLCKVNLNYLPFIGGENEA